MVEVFLSSINRPQIGLYQTALLWRLVHDMMITHRNHWMTLTAIREWLWLWS